MPERKIESFLYSPRWPLLVILAWTRDYDNASRLFDEFFLEPFLVARREAPVESQLTVALSIPDMVRRRGKC